MMEFDEMKKIWDTQNEETMYAINEETLYKRVAKKTTNINRMIHIFEMSTIILLLGVGLVTTIDSILDKEQLYTYIFPVIVWLIAGYIFNTRKKRKKVNQVFGTSILSTIHQGIANINFQIGRLKQGVWWFAIPFMTLYFISMYESFFGRPLWLWFMMPVWMVISYFLIRWEINKLYTPKKNELEKLKEMLLSEK